MYLSRRSTAPLTVASLALLASLAVLLMADAGAAEVGHEAETAGGQRLHHRSAGDEDFYRLFMVKRMLRDRLHQQEKRAGDFDRLMNQLEKLNRDSGGANADSMIFRLKKQHGGRGGSD